MGAWLLNSPMELNARKEEFSYAYIHAIASTAGFSVQQKARPMDAAGLDLLIETPGSLENGVLGLPKIEAQVKCTAVDAIVSEETVNFPLEVKNYNKLRLTDHLVPQLLIVVVVPKELESWLEVTESETSLRKCAYWLSLKGKEPTTNTTTITVHLPRKNLLTPESLVQLMLKVANRQDL